MENNNANSITTDTDIELLEFKAGDNSYGVDINDIREILPYRYEPTPIPNSHPFLEGVIMPRDFIIPIVNFGASILINRAAADNSSSDNSGNSIAADFNKNEEMLIVSNISNQNIAFHVDSVNGIHRINTSQIEKPGKKLTTKQKNVITGVFKNGERKIEIVDFRRIIKIINPNINVD